MRGRKRGSLERAVSTLTTAQDEGRGNFLDGSGEENAATFTKLYGKRGSGGKPGFQEMLRGEMHGYPCFPKQRTTGECVRMRRRGEQKDQSGQNLRGDSRLVRIKVGPKCLRK